MKMEVVVGVVSSTKSAESEESERFYDALMIQWKNQVLRLVYSSASASDSDNPVFTVS